MGKEQGAYMLLTKESSEPMEFGIFDFYRVFSRAFSEGGNGGVGTQNGSRGMSSPTPG